MRGMCGDLALIDMRVRVCAFVYIWFVDKILRLFEIRFLCKNKGLCAMGLLKSAYKIKCVLDFVGLGIEWK